MGIYARVTAVEIRDPIQGPGTAANQLLGELEQNITLLCFPSENLSTPTEVIQQPFWK
jgi:hypothetical protein